MVSIKPSFPPSWTPDDERNNCSRCDGPFTMLNRKHHCRACGKIFCSECSAHNGSIPSYVHKVYNTNGSRGLRLCSGCNTLIIEKKRSKRFILIFSMIPLPIRELETLLYVNKEWKRTGYEPWSSGKASTTSTFVPSINLEYNDRKKKNVLC